MSAYVKYSAVIVANSKLTRQVSQLLRLLQ